MKKITHISGLSETELDVINQAIEILAGNIKSTSKTKEQELETIQKMVLGKYLSGMTVSDLVSMCK